MNQGWRNSPRAQHAIFVLAHALLLVFAALYVYECSAILRAGL